jgi:hypothetical protein
LQLTEAELTAMGAKGNHADRLGSLINKKDKVAFFDSRPCAKKAERGTRVI